MFLKYSPNHCIANVKMDKQEDEGKTATKSFFIASN